MANNIVVEDGTGKSTATSYVSVADADNFFRSDINAASWALAASDSKAKCLALASRLIDQQFNYQGEPLRADQALSWPRSLAYDRMGKEIVGVPTVIKRITCKLANAMLQDSHQHN